MCLRKYAGVRAQHCLTGWIVHCCQYVQRIGCTEAGEAMPDCGEQQALRYSAFISYSHQDAAFARRLHRRLENYRLPRRVVQQPGPGMGKRRRLRPLFRDREELSAAPDLTLAVKRAIGEAGALIVVCSPAALDSIWVARELALFRELRRGGDILAVLVDGATNETVCSIFGSGKSMDGAAEPLAADFRRGGYGARLALLKLVAVLADVRLDELVQRDAQRRVRQVTAVSLAALAGMALMTTLTLAAINARNAVEHERARGEALVNYLLDDMRGRLKAVGSLDLLDALNAGALQYYRSQDLAHLGPTALEQRAKLLQAIGQDDESRGKINEASVEFEEAGRTTNSLLKQAPRDWARIYAHAQSEYWIGENSWWLGRFSMAEAKFVAYAELADRLVQVAPARRDSIMERGYARNALGVFFLRRSNDLAGAEEYFSGAKLDLEAAERLGGRDRSLLRDIADVDGWLGDTKRLKGDCGGALTQRTEARRILWELQQDDKRDAELRSALVGNELALARIEVCSGQLAAAIDRLKAGGRAALELWQNDPANADLRRQARIFDLFKARTWMMFPAASRPADTVIADAIGDCEAERRMAHNAELAEFCFILNGRRAAAKGDLRSAHVSLAAAEGLDVSAGNVLSARWGLNFREEESLAQ